MKYRSWPTHPGRRRFLRTMLAGGTVLGMGAGTFLARDACADGVHAAFDPIPNGMRLNDIPFIKEGDVALERTVGRGLNGRRALDLSRLDSANLVTPDEEFFVRTRVSDLLPSAAGWTVRVHGLVARPRDLDAAALARESEPAGVHLAECAGNTRLAAFGLISTARWSGVPLTRVLHGVNLKARAWGVRVSGFDRYPSPGHGSLAGADWILPLDQLAHSSAFLATGMNGAPLPRDHGAPVRLVVPGWYGCACIKWVDGVEVVDADAPPTSQMLEYAGRTYQSGDLRHARDFAPPVIDAAAMAVRVEQWRVGGRLVFRIVGILWGGARPVRSLSIQLEHGGRWLPVPAVRQRSNATWTPWSYVWRPSMPKRYWIRLRIDDPGVRARRLDSGFYVRGVDITHL